MKILKFAIVLIIISFSSCKKYGDGYVIGTVYETNTNNPLTEVKVYLERKKISHIESNYDFFIIDSCLTNPSGTYKFSFDKKRRYEYQLRARYTNYYGSSRGNYTLTLKKTEVNLELDPVAYIKFRIKKNSPSSNYFYTTINYHSTTVYSLQNITQPFDTILPGIYKVNGNAINYLNWQIYGTGIGPVEDQIYIAKGDTMLLFYQIN